jgi:hypothetical protein
MGFSFVSAVEILYHLVKIIAANLFLLNEDSPGKMLQQFQDFVTLNKNNHFLYFEIQSDLKQ